MSISKLGQRRQVVIPKDICEELGLQVGDFVEVTKENGAVILKPKKLVDADEALTPDEEELVERGIEQIKRGDSVNWEDLKDRLNLKLD